MGILAKTNCEKENILTRNGFEFEKISITGDVTNCYERCITLPIGYYAWISIKTSGEGMIYIEYNCGGEVARHSICLSNGWDNEEAFFDELDEEVTNLYELYK